MTDCMQLFKFIHTYVHNSYSSFSLLPPSILCPSLSLFSYSIEPSVFFNNPQIIVPESQQQVNVIIQRTGDLSKPTEVTCVVYSNNGTSVYNEDYHVVFKREQNETFFTIIVHPVVEGTEVLSIHMKEPYDGQMRTPNVAQVVILNVKQGRHANTHPHTYTCTYLQHTRTYTPTHTHTHTHTPTPTHTYIQHTYIDTYMDTHPFMALV